MKRSRSVTTPPPSDFTRPRPPQSPTGWQDGLIYALSDQNQIFEQDDLTVTLYDAFPKARYHYLVVPREDIHSVKELSRDNLELLKHIHKVAEDLIGRVRKKEPNTPFRFGYHAIPSLNRLHLHIVSQDFDSPKLWKRHHWNTFNTEYFMDSSKVIEGIEKDGKIEVDDKAYEELLTLRMHCNFKECHERFDDIYDLKDHLQEHYGCQEHHKGPVFIPKKSSRHRRQSNKF